MPDLLGTAPADLIDAAVEPAVATRSVATRRAERIRTGVVNYAAMRQDIADAYAQRDWLALEYPSWYAYLDGEFGEELRALASARTERRAVVADLRGQGMSTRQIASATGVGQSQVRRDLAEVSPNGSPTEVVGADGKTYAATRLRETPERADRGQPQSGPTPGKGAAAAVVSTAAAPTPERTK
ncbi:MAG TPA: helix-turn-helix domain-containing protein, partial [Pseudonocardiaceae bacterium]|nr:helix-turn-helix domain-containing protein [Pseudonocardiaceae bacterium]